MKTPREWAKEFDNIDFVGFIADIQKDAYNQAILNVMDSTEDGYISIITVDKLKLK